MSRTLFLLFAALLGPVLTAASAEAQTPAPGTYRIEPGTSEVSFQAGYLLLLSTKGRFDSFDGSVQRCIFALRSDAVSMVDDVRRSSGRPG